MLYSRSLLVIYFIYSSAYLLIPKWFLKIRDNWLIAMFWVTTDTQLHEPRTTEEERQNTLLLRPLPPRIRTTMLARLQFSSVAQSCPTLCDSMNRSTPGLPVHHQLPEFNQTHVHRVSDAIQPSHPLSSPSPPAPNPSQHQSLFQ